MRHDARALSQILSVQLRHPARRPPLLGWRVVLGTTLFLFTFLGMAHADGGNLITQMDKPSLADRSTGVLQWPQAYRARGLQDVQGHSSVDHVDEEDCEPHKYPAKQ